MILVNFLITVISNEHDVAIIGLGPVGCTAALFLAEAGVRVAAVERDREVYQLPRAVNLDGEIIRAFQRIGRAEAVDRLMQKVRANDRGGFANSRREWLFGQDFAAFGSNGWQPLNMFHQPEFETYLRRQALEHPNVVSFVGFEAEAIRSTGRGIELDISEKETGDPGTLFATYVIGCDGASSFVRRLFNIGWQSLGYDCDWLVVDVTVRDGHTLNNDTLQVCDPDRIQTYVCTKDPYRRWEFKFNPGETPEEMLQEDRILSLIDAWTPRGTYDIRRAAVYRFHAATADRWRTGNVFIAGDAAHQTPPFLGQGMNAGMRDAINLGWKLPLVMQGRADDALLDTYEPERGPHAHDLVDWAVNIGKLMDHTAEVELAVREGRTPPEAPAKMQSSGYGQGRAQPPVRGGAVMREQVSDTGATGYLFSQPDVLFKGREHKLDSLLGPGFALVSKEEQIKLTDQSRGILDQLDANLVSLHGMEPVRGRFDRLFRKHSAALIRPDRLVFGHTTDQCSVDELIGTAAVKLALTNHRKQSK